MAIVRTILWSLAKRAAADPRVRKKAGQAFRTVDKGMDKAADKVADVAAARIRRARRARCSAPSFPARSGPSAEGSPLPAHLVRVERTRTSTGLPPLAPEASASTNSATTARSDGAAERTRTSTGSPPQRPQRCASTSSATAARHPHSKGGRSGENKVRQRLVKPPSAAGYERPRRPAPASGLNGRASRPPTASSIEAPRCSTA